MDVVISGIGGRFPRSKNIQEFSKNLLAGKSLLEPAKRWIPGSLGTPLLGGHVENIDQFDYTFFGMHKKLTEKTDLATLLGIESCFEALIDAGVHPGTIRGTNAHIYVSCSRCEDKYTWDDWFDFNGYVIVGKEFSMTANRVSFALNLTGKSVAISESEGSLARGLALARNAIQSGECETAFVSGLTVQLAAEICKQKVDMGLLSPDSVCCPFDIDVNGGTASEAQVTFLVQRADIAKRSYGSIVVAEGETSSGLPNWFLSVNEKHLKTFVNSQYKKNGVDPNSVKILEADGLCIKDMVEAELNVLDDVLNSKRPKNAPLYLGSVKTITGDTDAADGHTALTKLILAMETGIISPTINCGKLNPNISGLSEGRFHVVTKPTPWEVTQDTHVAVSCLTTIGTVGHVVLKANGKTKQKSIEKDYSLPYLVLMCGRNSETVETSLQKVISSPFDPEYIRLVQEVFSVTIDQFEWRGFAFFGQSNSEKLVVQRENRRPVWFVFSGMGSQWTGMGKDLMLFPIVQDTFQRLHCILEQKGLNLIRILTSSEPSIFDNILNSFVGIAAIQIALTNLLNQLGITPDGIIGHSVGELGCSYADGCLTEEQTILAAYERGMASAKAELVPGLMAAVGLGNDSVKPLLPPDVCVACRNAKDSCTISGPKESVEKVIKMFEKDGIFVRGVNVSNIAYHSPYIRPAAPYLFEALKNVIPSPKLRSSKWVCTSAPEAEWDSDEVRYCSAEYHTNNLLNPVLFEEGSACIPKNALVIEIAPHGLLQAIMKRSMGNEVAHVPLTRKGAAAPAKFLLQAIGKMFLEGLSPKIWHLYPEVQFPVSRGTPSLVPLIGWDHNDQFSSKAASQPLTSVSTTLYQDSCPCVELAGMTTVSTAHALILTWDAFAEVIRQECKATAVIFEDIYLQDVLEFEDGKVEVSVQILPRSGQFVVERNGAVIIQGKIRSEDDDTQPIKVPEVCGNVENFLDSEDVYAELMNQGIGMSSNLKGVRKVEIYPQDWIATLNPKEDWISLLNSLFTLCLLKNSEGDQIPAYVSHIRKLVINPAYPNTLGSTARYHLPSSTLTYKGITLVGVEFTKVIKPNANTNPFSLQFIPYGQTCLEDEDQFLSNLLQLSADKRLASRSTYKVCDVDGKHNHLIARICNLLHADNIGEHEKVNHPKDGNLILCGLESLLGVCDAVQNTSLLLTRCGEDERKVLENLLEQCGLVILAESKAKSQTKPLVVIAHRLPPLQPSNCNIIKMKPEDGFPATLKDTCQDLIILVWEHGTTHPIEMICRQIKSKSFMEKIRIIVLETGNSRIFSISDPFFADQLRLNVPVNVYSDGKWGSYRLTRSKKTPMAGGNIHWLDMERGAVHSNRCNSHFDGDEDTPFRKHTGTIVKQYSSEAFGYCTKKSTSQYTMGIASSDGNSERVIPDSHLAWSLPVGWNCDEAANIPLPYALGYYALCEVARIQAGKIIFITCPLTPIGHAAAHIALSLGCEVVVLVQSSEETSRLKSVFPQFQQKNIIESSTEIFPALLKKKYTEGVDVILSDLAGLKLRASTSCLKSFGRILQVSDDPMVKHDYIGMFMFTCNCSQFGVTPKALLHLPVDLKRRIVKWVQEGLDSKLIDPYSQALICGTSGVLNKTRISFGENYYEAFSNHHVNGNETTTSYMQALFQGDRKCSIISGGSQSQWLRLSYWLAKKGAKVIALVQETPAPSLVFRHSKILKKDFGTDLKVFRTNIFKSSLLSNISKLSAIKAIFSFENISWSEELVSALDAGSLHEAAIIFISKYSTPLSRKCEGWFQNGINVRAALGVEDDSTDRLTPILDWILSPAAPPVTVLESLDGGMKMTSLDEGRWLPTSAAQLRALGSCIRDRALPTFRKLVTQNIRYDLEVYPLFYMKGIHGTATHDLQVMGTNLLAPLVEVTLPKSCSSLEETAIQVIQGVKKIQSRGPYNLGGDTIRTAFVMKVARLLEDNGDASVVFLSDEGWNDIRQTVRKLQDKNELGEFLLHTSLRDNVDQKVWCNVQWNSLSWNKQLETVTCMMPGLDDEQREDVIAALNYVFNSVQLIMETQDALTLNHGTVHILVKGEKYLERKIGKQVFSHNIPDFITRSKQFADVISSNLATPVLQLNIERSTRITKF